MGAVRFGICAVCWYTVHALPGVCVICWQAIVHNIHVNIQSPLTEISHLCCSVNCDVQRFICLWPSFKASIFQCIVIACKASRTVHSNILAKWVHLASCIWTVAYRLHTIVKCSVYYNLDLCLLVYLFYSKLAWIGWMFV